MVSDGCKRTCMRQWLRGVVACAVLLAAAAQAAPSVADYQRSLGLRAQWMTLTENVSWPAQWHDADTFYYRKTVPGGFAFMREDLATLQKTPAFDHAQLARAVSATGGNSVTATTLPFERFAYAQEAGRADGAVEFEIGDTSWRCTLTNYQCAPVAATAQPRPRGFVWCAIRLCRPTPRRGARPMVRGRWWPMAGICSCGALPTARVRG